MLAITQKYIVISIFLIKKNENHAQLIQFLCAVRVPISYPLNKSVESKNGIRDFAFP
jgi:hypothetical protein